MKQTTTVIIVSYNKRPYTELCLGSMLRAEPVPDQLIVVDNGSADGSVELLDERIRDQAMAAGVDYTLIANYDNAGACTARNQALALARGEYIAFADNDVAVRSRDWLAALGHTLDEQSDVGIAGPKLLFPFEPYNIQCAGVAISPSGRVEYCGRGQSRNTAEFSEPRTVQCLTSACWVMRRELYEDIGDLDEVFNPAQYEDFDYCYRAREAGWEILYQPAAEMYHFENTTTDGSANLNFAYVTIKHGAVFKQRWGHIFSREGGPPDEHCKWLNLELKSIEEVGSPPME